MMVEEKDPQAASLAASAAEDGVETPSETPSEVSVQVVHKDAAREPAQGASPESHSNGPPVGKVEGSDGVGSNGHADPGREAVAVIAGNGAAPLPGDETSEDASHAPQLPEEGDMSFAEMFELAERQSAERRKRQQQEIGGSIRPGQVIFARIVSISGDSIFLDVGAKAEGVIPKAELTAEDGTFDLKEGDKVEARVRKFESGVVILTKVLPHQSLKNREELLEAHRTGIPVEGRVTDKNKGGFDIQVAGMRAFCPASQIDLRPGPAENYIGRKYPFQIVEFKQDGRNIVVSRRSLLLEENKRKAESVLKELEIGSVVYGKVTSLKDYGAFIDIGGLEGLVHMSELSHGHIGKPKDFLQIGQDVQAKVLKIEEGKKDSKKISLSIKALERDPWDAAPEQIKNGQKVTGKVARIQSFGAFVEIMPGVDGLIHVSNMSSGRRIKDPREIVKEGDEVEATVISIDFSKKRIGLSLVKTPQELANELRKSDVHEGTVDKVEGFGLFVRLPTGARGLVPAAETGTSRGADLKKEFNVGDKVKVLVQDTDRRSGKIRLSIRAAREAEERAEYAGYLTESSGRGKGLGTLGDLLKAQLGGKLTLGQD